MDKINIAKELILKEIPDVMAIYIFGSYASQTQGEKSDIDLAILHDKKISKEYLWNLSQKIATKVQLEIDLIDLLEASTVFAFQIINEGKLLYSSDEKNRAIYENSIDSMYLDLNEMRKDIIENIKKRKEVY
ncbi:MAG: hypothetical protein K940chlam1_00925 [Candidatus Anoxychlamydiales bacterium]|nr:hypothetical protein [Candidatus Anoxychlamydiales bacterium]NGX35680.1 hypothetical protein [Candidatus Anoxychlamydiales bacterium]